MQYRIIKLEQKEYEGRKYAKVFVEALDGQTLDASLGDKWGDKLLTFKEGDRIEANAWQNPKNEKWSLYPIEDRKPSGGAGGAYKQAVIEKAVARKEEGIARSQDNKEHGIKVSSTMRMAVDLALAEKDDANVLDTLEEGIRKWRRYCWDNWDVDAKDIDPTDGTLLK